MNENTTDVVIVGAGPVALSLATGLVKEKVNFRIFERESEPERYTKACNLWSRTMEVYAALGVLELLMAESSSVSVQILHAYGKFIRHNYLDRFPSPYNAPVLIGQNSIERILSDFLAGHNKPVERSSNVTSIKCFDDYVEVVVERENGLPEIVRAKYVVGCDGGKSTVREQSGITLETEAVPERALRLCDVRRLKWSRSTEQGQIWFFFHDTGYLGVLPFYDGTFRLWIIEDEKNVPDREPTLDEIEQAAAEVIGDTTLELSDAIWLSHGKFRHGVAEALQNGRIFLAGDAGHVTIPVGGQGMNTGIQDAFALGWRLGEAVRGEVNPVVLETYDAERQKVKKALHDEQADSMKQHTDPSEFSKFLFRWLGPTAVLGDQIAETNTRRNSQLEINYSDSLLSKNYGSGGLRAGERFPDASVVEAASGITKQIFELIYQGKWTLLLFDGANNNKTTGKLLFAATAIENDFPLVTPYLILADAKGVNFAEGTTEVFLDLDHFAHAACEVKSPTMFLIRPDGHIGFRGTENHLDELLDYCSAIFKSQQ
jgi:3-(3-hydroxy-phenyl)propionate hydroxylase